MGRSLCPVKQVFKNACVECNISSGGSIKQMIHRLTTYEKQKDKKRNDNKLKKIKKVFASGSKSCLKMSAQEYVAIHCNNDLSQASPQLVSNSKGTNVKLRIPKLCNSKAGKIIRWVLFKK